MIYLNQKKNQQIIIMEIKEELSLEDIDKLLLQEEELNLTSDIKQQISESYEFLKEFSKENHFCNMR